MSDVTIIDDDDFYSPEDIHALISAASSIAVHVVKAEQKFGPYSSYVLSLRAAWAAMDEEIENHATEEEYDLYQRAMEVEPQIVPNHPGTGTQQ